MGMSLALIERALTQPATHRVVTLFAATDDRSPRIHDVRNAAAAESWAIGERRKIGRTLRGVTGLPVNVTAVVIGEL